MNLGLQGHFLSTETRILFSSNKFLICVGEFFSDTEEGNSEIESYCSEPSSSNFEILTRALVWYFI